MRVPWSWLREFVPVESEPEEVAARLSLRGLEVEEVVRLGTDITGVIVGAVVKVEDHPDAENLVLVTVDTGRDVREIVCGARNFGPGDLVPVAVPGARLPGGVEIGERSVRGKVSRGMLCSARELGLGEDHSGILVLSSGVLGTDVRAVLGLDEVVLDIDLTPNRPDALSILGVAREVSVLEGVPLTMPPVAVPEGGSHASELARVTVKDARGCPRYLARVITGLSNGTSPQWMQRRLTAAGMRPISGIVDVTNYVLLERGHPLHAFDLTLLDGPEIIVRKPRKGERIATLDGLERTLEPLDLLICDAARPVAIAGVMGGAGAEVSETTTTVLLESAYFDPHRIAATSRRLGLRTEASVRFERGADPEAPGPAADRACELLASVCGGTAAPGAIDVAARRPKTKPIRLRVSRAHMLIGETITPDDMAGILRSLGMDVTRSGRTTLRVVPPSFRPDVTMEEDLVEEVARVHGYDRIAETLPAAGRTGGLTRDQSLRRLVRRLLLGAGLSEAHTLSLLSSALPDRLGLPADHPWRNVVHLANPLSDEESTLRPSLLPGLLLAVERNIARRVPTVALFEIGTAFAPSEGELPTEELRVGFVLAGRVPAGWYGERSFDVFDAKGAIEALLEGLGCREIETEAGERAELHPGRTARLVSRGEEIGWLGEIHPRIARALDLPGRAAAAELRLAALLQRSTESAARDLPRFPAVDRDIAVVVPDGTAHTEVAGAIRDAGGPLLDDLELFDLYRGEQVGEGNTSLAYRLAFRSPERTLTDADAAAAMEAIVIALGERGWRPRE